MDSASKFGVIEAISVASGSVALLNTLRRIISHMSDERFSGRKATVKLLEHQLENTIKEYKRSSGSLELPAVVQERLKQLEKVAEELEKNVSSHKLRRVWDKLTHKGFEERIGKLRTGISDIANALTVPASLNQVGPAMSQQHHISAAAPALSPAQRLVQVQFCFLTCMSAIFGRSVERVVQWRDHFTFKIQIS